jgi:hypothetical protein
MASSTTSIELLLALARQRRLWPEVEPVPAEQSLAESPKDEIPPETETELALALEALRQQAAYTLGPRLPAAAPLFAKLAAILAHGSTADLDAAWAALDALEDQLEALSGQRSD